MCFSLLHSSSTLYIALCCKILLGYLPACCFDFYAFIATFVARDNPDISFNLIGFSVLSFHAVHKKRLFAGMGCPFLAKFILFLAGLGLPTTKKIMARVRSSKLLKIDAGGWLMMIQMQHGCELKVSESSVLESEQREA